ncbi:MAG: hypothetical protein KBG15_01695 [Kofleriaceae bacterium]|nr:hypothetical protein [Kofleriaceae bacterium]
MGSNHDDDISDNNDAPVPADASLRHGRELTGRELLAAAQRDGGNLPALLDPQTAAELARWFEQPASAHSGQVAPSTDEAEPSLFDQTQKIRATAMAAAQPEFLASVERWFTRNDALRYDDSYAVGAAQKFTTVTTAVEQFTHRLVLQTPVERERAMDLDDALQECTPQALLRDLHRPAEFFSRELQLEPTREPVFDSKPPVSSFFLSPAAHSFATTSIRVRESLALIRELHDRNWATIETQHRRPASEPEASP